MRIALIIPHFSPRQGGAEGMATAVVAGLTDRGHEVHVLAQDGRAGSGVSLHLVAPGAPTQDTLARVRPDVTVDWGLTTPADLHRLGGGLHEAFIGFNALSYRPPLRWVKSLEARLLSRHRRVIARERQLLRRPEAHLLAVSEFVASQVRRTGQVPPERITVQHNGVDTARFSPQACASLREEARAELQLRNEDVLFLFVGHNLRLKNLALLLAVFEAVAPDLPDAKLAVAGKRAPRCRRPWLRYAGDNPQPERLYAAADVLLHPTYFDACANVVLEALACGLPVVSSPLNGSAERICHGHSGFLAPVAGPPASVLRQWAAHVVQLCTSPALRQETGHNAWQTASGLTMGAYVDRVEALLASISVRRRQTDAAAADRDVSG